MTFSSYGGTITSTDDFTMINEKMVVLETTLSVLVLKIFLELTGLQIQITP